MLKKIVLFLIKYIDENYHQKRIFNFLKEKYDSSIKIIFDRNIEYRKVEIDSTFPEYIFNNTYKFRKWII